MENSRLKFRAWDIKQKIMVYSNENNSACYWDGIYCSTVDLINYRLLKDNLEELEWMQYTGLCDKNGVDIYEEDIMIDGSGKIGVIKYFFGTNKIPNGFGGFEQFTKRNDGSWEHFKTMAFNGLEVIGNTFEDQELIDNVERIQIDDNCVW
jgi:uncharacterized phage protein (TIGR01671 family)